MTFLRAFAGAIFLAMLVAKLAVAQQAGGPQSSAQHAAKVPALVSGGITDGVYRNPHFAFFYKIPFGWVDRTAEMQENGTSQPAPDPAKGQVLLGVFEHPPEATTETINATVVIAAESISSYPGLKTAADYFAPLEEVVVAAKGFKVVNEPYEFSVGARQVAREDFSKERGKLTMHQATLVLLSRGYVLSFTFIAGSDDEVDELMEGLSFAATARPGSAHPGAKPAARKNQPSGSGK